jgi:hypothetical protein
MVMQYKSLELTGFFSRSQGAGRQAGSSHASMPQVCRNEMGGRSEGRPNGRQASKLLRQASGCGRLAVAAGKLLRQASCCGRQAIAAGKLLRQASCCGRQAVAAG